MIQLPGYRCTEGPPRDNGPGSHGQLAATRLLRRRCERLTASTPRLRSGRKSSVSPCGRLTPTFGGRTAAMALTPRLSSGSAMEPVATRPDALEVGPRSTGAGRKAAIDRIPGDGISEEPFDRGVSLPHVHGTVSLRQNLDHGPQGPPVAETRRPRGLRHGSVFASLIRKTRRKCIENARKRWRMV